MSHAPCIYHRYNWHFDGWKLEGVQWSAMPRQIPSLIALFMVVTFGSALDVAAIQQDTPFPLDFNQELVTVGERCTGRPFRRHTAIPATLENHANAGFGMLQGRLIQRSVSAGISNAVAGVVGAGMTDTPLLIPHMSSVTPLQS